ncbi:MAG TPA: glycosyltransferase family 39 protein, partial [Thermoanaerobaculia bacterium]
MTEERRDDRWFWVALAGIVAIGAWLRFRLLGVPSLWLDELLNYDIVTAAARQPWEAWLVGFEVENGPLYYALQLASRVVTDVELSSRLAPAVVGTTTVALIGVLGRRISITVGLVAAILAAVSPLHVYYSREGRAYALLMLFATLILFALVDERVRRPAAISIAALVGAALTAATAAPLIVAAGATAVLRLPFSRRRGGDLATLAGAAAGIGILALHYLKYDRPKPALGMPPVDFELIAKIVNGFTVTAFESPMGGLLPWTLVAVAFVGAIAILRRDRATGVALASMTLLPIVVTIVALSVMRHWFSIRYVSFALPPFLLLVAIGVES